MPGGSSWNLRCAISAMASDDTLFGIAREHNIAIAIVSVACRHAELLRADGDHRVLDLLARPRRGAAEHDRHAAADRTVRRQRRQRIRMHDADRVGSRSSISPTTVAASVSCPWPRRGRLHRPTMAPVISTLTLHASIQVVVSFFGLNSGSKAELPPEGSRQQDMPMPASLPAARAASRRHQRGNRRPPAPCRAPRENRRCHRCCRTGSCRGIRRRG